MNKPAAAGITVIAAALAVALGAKPEAPHTPIIGEENAMPTETFDTAGRRLAYDDTRGAGPLVIAAPGLGDLRQSYRYLRPKLEAAGYRVVTVDLPGHGESSTNWPDVSPEAFGDALLDLTRHLNAGPAYLIGNSYSGAAVAWAAARDPKLVRGVVLIDPFVRDEPVAASQALMMKLAFGGPWRNAAWTWYFNTLFATRKPADHAAYTARLRRNLAEPGRFDTLKAMFATGRERVSAHLKDIRSPALVIMGSQDPDFKDPAREADLVATAVHGRAAMIPGAGHYPHAEMPDATTPVILDFLNHSSAN